MQSLFRQFNRLNLSLLLFIISCANYLGFQLYGGEEQYFAFAKHFMDPGWIPHSFSLSHSPGGNFLFEVIAGFFLRYISFNTLAFYGRMVNFLLLCIPLAHIFKYFKLSNLESVVLFQLFFLPHQSFFAGEWIFQDFEVKTLAYIFVLYGISFLLKKKIYAFTFAGAIATYFHFLVGGWFFLLFMIFLLVQRIPWRKLVMAAILYIAVLTPYIIYLAQLYIIGNRAVINGVNTNWIYVYDRLPFHLGIFKSWRYFMHIHMDGVTISLTLYVLCLLYFRKFKHPHIQILNKLNIILFSEQFIFIIVAVFDREGILLKTYPFRTSTLSSLLIMIEFALLIKYYLLPGLLRRFVKTSDHKIRFNKRVQYLTVMNSVLLVLFLAFFVSECIQTFSGENTDIQQPSARMVKMMDYIRENTRKEDVILILFRDDPAYFQRLAERESFVVWKYTPTTSTDIYEWYERERLKNKIKQNIANLSLLTGKYRVNYVIGTGTYRNSMLEMVYSLDNLYLYRVKPELRQ